MRAALQERYGGPDVVTIGDIDPPEIGDEDVLVRIHATTVNRTDCAYRAAHPFFMRALTGLWRPKCRVWGTEYAGVVEAVGAAVSDFTAGDRVFGYNEGEFGAHAELLSVPASAPIALLPASVSFAQGAAATEGAHYALSSLEGAGVSAGHDVLVYGATGAIGSAAVQWAKIRGAAVTAVCATEHLDLVRGLGADRVVDYTTGDFTDDEQSYDLVIDAVGKSTFGACRRLLKPRGRYVSSELGPGAQNIPLALITPVFRGRAVRFDVPKIDRALVQSLAERLATGEFAPLVDRHYSLDEIVEAYRYVETGQKVGSVVIDVVAD